VSDSKALDMDEGGRHADSVTGTEDLGCGDCDRRRLLIGATAAVGAAGLGVATTPFIASMGPSARALALGGPVKLDVSTIEPAQQVTMSWRGRPVWILNRTPDMLERLAQAELILKLRDPASATSTQQPDYARNATRSIRPQYLVVVGLCTHLGCVPTLLPADATRPRDDVWSSGYYCPCHGSRFDFAGRVAKGVPAPTNLVVPPHRYLDPNTLEVGVDHA